MFTQPNEMNLTLTQPVSTSHDNRHLWLPPRRMWQYTLVRIGGGLLFGITFVGWMILQGSNPVMRFIAGGLILFTAWITFASIRTDIKRSRGRQITLEPGAIVIDTPDHHHRIQLADIAYAQWREQTEAEVGLWLYDKAGNVLAPIDAAFLANQAEARTFLGWARQQTELPFAVRWPNATSI